MFRINRSSGPVLASAAAALVGGILLSGTETVTALLPPDNGDHYYCRTSSNSNLVSAYNHASGQMQTLPGWSMFPNNCSDAKMFDGFYGAGWLGETSCSAPNWSFTRCDIFNVKIDAVSNGSNLAKWKATACHEFGHTVGLPHNGRTTSCMLDPATSDPLYFDDQDDAVAWLNWFQWK